MPSLQITLYFNRLETKSQNCVQKLSGYRVPDLDNQAGVDKIASPVLEAHQIHLNLNLNEFVGIIEDLPKKLQSALVPVIFRTTEGLVCFGGNRWRPCS
ncbi:hypothetical protein AVEN_127820-1 [Araneus ventricosus]|uniref:Uncharacterized protein n=1 Tax=Araneus ventricosus TaxID=182803 RepID=A0A4Y1ZZD2_ARAVE|nr:hypothetical protein AVEN_127820-1 [Araneus ventricosus]